MPPNRRNSYTNSYKLKIIEEAEMNGNRVVGRKEGINESVIRGWRRMKNVLKVSNPKKRSRRHTAILATT